MKKSREERKEVSTFSSSPLDYLLLGLGGYTLKSGTYVCVCPSVGQGSKVYVRLGRLYFTTLR